ncbi:MAG: diaminopimelate epimerase [Elusimicrobiota bacterium]|nr:diaminopimelate epimerase [Elusimicrobiota bacterium]
MNVPFWKLTGAGNDFVLLSGLPKGKSGAALARALCDRRSGVGADGLLVMSRRAGKVRLDYWNADGSAAFCGNGSRCAALWAAARGWVKGKEFTLDTNRGPLTARLTGKGRAEVTMPSPRGLRLGVNVKTEGRSLQAHYVDTGVPHAVVFVPDIDKVRVDKVGRALRVHKAFGRAGANVDFVEIRKNLLFVRTYERGVEAETLACGTGVVAAAFVSRVLGFDRSPVRVAVRGGDALCVSFDDGPRLEGPGKIVFSGEVTL